MYTELIEGDNNVYDNCDNNVYDNCDNDVYDNCANEFSILYECLSINAIVFWLVLLKHILM